MQFGREALVQYIAYELFRIVQECGNVVGHNHAWSIERLPERALQKAQALLVQSGGM
jgi:hypothetical protein